MLFDGGNLCSQLVRYPLFLFVLIIDYGMDREINGRLAMFYDRGQNHKCFFWKIAHHLYTTYYLVYHVDH
jgi:hypothetical protein